MKSRQIAAVFLQAGAILGLAVGTDSMLEQITNLGPLCNTQNYIDCHEAVKENLLRCEDSLCLCYYSKTLSQECVQLCAAYHHETYYRLRNFESSCELAGMKVSSSDSKSDLKVGI